MDEACASRLAGASRSPYASLQPRFPCKMVSLEANWYNLTPALRIETDTCK